MLFAHGWPKVYATDLAPGDGIVHVHIDHQYVLLVTHAGIQLWASGQHRVKLGSCNRTASEVEAEGHNINAFWSSARNSLAVVTSRNYLHFYAVHTWKDPVLSLGKTSDQELRKVDVYLRQSVAVDGESKVTCVTGNGRTLVLGLDDGSLVAYSWLGKARNRCDALWVALEGRHIDGQNGGASEEPRTPPRSSVSSVSSGALSAAVAHMHYCESIFMLSIVFSDGACVLFKAPENGLHQLEQLELSSWLCPPYRQAVCSQIGPSAQMVAVGCASGEVALYRLYPTSLAHQQQSTVGGSGVLEDPYDMLVRVLSLHDWGHRASETGAAAQVEWSPDCRALAVGYEAQGVAVWTPSGCRLACSLRQTPSLNASVFRSQSLAPSFSDMADAAAEEGAIPVEGGVTGLAWGQCGYQLVVAERGAARMLVELQFAKSLPNNHRVAHGRGPLVRRAGARDSEVHVLVAHDRLLMISDAADQREPRSAFREDADGGSNADLAVHHVLVPHAYLNANWPIMHAAVSTNGANLAVAGKRGLAVYSRPSERWRLFGDVSQERTINCLALCWLDSMLVVVSAMDPTSKSSTGPCELLVFPRYHLDFGSLLARYPLPTRPSAMDCVSDFILIASEPLELAVLQVQLQGELAPSAAPQATITLVRELSIMNAGLPLLDIALVPPPADRSAPPSSQQQNGSSSPPPPGPRLPKHCVLLRWGGMMSVLDMELGSELPLSSDVEAFWLSDSHPLHLALPPPYRHPSMDHRHSFDFRYSDGSKGDRLGVTDSGCDPSTSSAPVSGEGDVEMPWWAYGSRGMQLWFPSSLTQPISPPRSPRNPAAMDIELEFDREVYPVGISWSDAAIVGLTQRLVGGTASSAAPASAYSIHASPCFHLLPESQPVLPCLLRRLLQAGAQGEAHLLARRHQRGHHFLRSLEWLLFTALELDTSKRTPPAPKLTPSSRSTRSVGEGSRGGGGDVRARPGMMIVSPLLSASAELIRQFPQFADVVVSVARKTDASLWPTLFAAVGSPSVLLEGLLDAGALRSAACFLLVIDRLEGSALAHSLALRLLRASLKRAQYQLSAELLRFVIPPGELDNIFGADASQRRSGSNTNPTPLAMSPNDPTPSTPTSPLSGASAFASDESYTTWLLSPLAAMFQKGPAAASSPTAPTVSSADAAVTTLAAAAESAAAAAEHYSLLSVLSGQSSRGLEGGARLERGASGAGAPARGATAGYGKVGRSSTGRRNTVEGLGDAPSQTPGVDACKMVADHAWQLLEGGRLSALAQLSASMTFLPGGGLGALMNFSWATSQLLKPVLHPPTCGSDLLSALAVTVQELPVWDNDRVQKDAELVLAATRQVGAVTWAVAVAVVLVEVDTVVEFRAAYPEMWRDFCDLLKEEPTFDFLFEVVDALSAAVQEPPPGGAAQGGEGGGGTKLERRPSLNILEARSVAQ